MGFMGINFVYGYLAVWATWAIIDAEFGYLVSSASRALTSYTATLQYGQCAQSPTLSSATSWSGLSGH